MLSEFVIEVHSLLRDSLRRSLAARGFRVEAPAKLMGASGAEHWADLSATSPDGRTILVDICVSHDIVNEEQVISTNAKVLDTSPSEAFLFVMPKTNNVASELAQSYNIRLIEGISVEDLMMSFERGFPLQTV